MMLSVILLLSPQTGSHISRQADSSTWLIRREPRPDRLMFFFSLRQKAIRAQQTAKALVVSASQWKRGSEREAVMHKNQWGSFLAPLNLEKPPAVVQCHCGRWIGKWGRDWNVVWLGMNTSVSSEFCLGIWYQISLSGPVAAPFRWYNKKHQPVWGELSWGNNKQQQNRASRERNMSQSWQNVRDKCFPSVFCTLWITPEQ